MSRYAGYDTSDDHQPLLWLRGHPFYVAHLIVLVFVASLFATTALLAFNARGLLSWLPFSSALVLHGEIWRVLTYGFYNPPSLWFVVDMFMLAWFGRELERFFGRRIFLGLYGSLYLLSPLLFTALGVWQPMYLAGESGAFALFIAFATLYPDAVMIFNILAKWVALILVGIYTLIHLSERNLMGLVSLWATTGWAFAFVRYQQGRIALPSFSRWWRSRSRTTAESGATFRIDPPSPSKAKAMAEVDALLDKIAQSGIHSLTPQERAKLERAARDGLMRK
jgi:membrane associated rhomboid family serine protease